MKRGYVALAVLVTFAAVALAALGRPHAPATSPPAVTVTAPITELALVITNGRVTPAVAVVPKDARVRIRVENHGTAPARLALAGYEDALAVPALAPGGMWQGAFLANRPGEDFAWLLDGEPAGRLTVTGSHLVEGHQ